MHADDHVSKVALRLGFISPFGDVMDQGDCAGFYAASQKVLTHYLERSRSPTRMLMRGRDLRLGLGLFLGR
jgi:hypothetical protein